jgi:hypothetical protein
MNKSIGMAKQLPKNLENDASPVMHNGLKMFRTAINKGTVIVLQQGVTLQKVTIGTKLPKRTEVAAICQTATPNLSVPLHWRTAGSLRLMTAIYSSSQKTIITLPMCRNHRQSFCPKTRKHYKSG